MQFNQDTNTVTIDDQVYRLNEMTGYELEELHNELFEMASEASTRHNRHGWQGGEDAYREWHAANQLARDAIEFRLDDLLTASLPGIPTGTNSYQ